VGEQDGLNDWLPLSQAAQAEGISLDAMRRRVRRGEYQRRQVRTRHGVAWQVRLNPGAQGGTHGGSTVDTDAPWVAPTDAPTVAPTVDPGALVDGQLVVYLRERDEQLAQIQAELLARSEAAATWQARAEMLLVQLQQAETRLLALEAPRTVPDALGRDSGAVRVEPTQAPAEGRQGRPWWQFWRG
jgi:hypothetical protein